MINQFILSLDRTTRLEFYNAFGTVMYGVMAVLFIWTVMTNGIKFKTSAFLCISFATSFLLSPRICILLDQITNGVIPDKNLGIAFLPFLAIYCLLALLFKMQTTTALDIAVPMYVGGRGICVIGCIFTGCCHGAAAEWGIYSHHAERNTVPCPLIDSVLSLAIAIVLVFYGRKNGLNGKAAACGLIAFGSLRYIIDMLRDNDKILDLITAEGIFGFIYACIGLTILYILAKRHPDSPQ